jgi:RNA polymerase sigma-70 factor (ECF subfamily)
VSLDGIGDVPEPLPEPLPEIDPEKLQQALNELPELFRTPIILYYFEDFSYRDIAEQMELPIGTVMSRLARAKAFLRSRLLPPGEEVTVNGHRPRRATDGL